MSKYKVAYIINDAAFFVSHRLPLALEVLNAGGKVCLITGYNVNKEKENNALKTLKKEKILHHKCLFSQSIANPLIELIGLIQLIYYLVKFKPTTIHSATSKANLLASIASNFLPKLRLVLSVSGVGTLFIGENSIKKKIIRNIYKACFKFALKRVNFSIIFQNKSDYKKYQSIINFKIDQAKIVGGSGVDTSIFKPKIKKINSRNILLPARMLYEKGIEEFVIASKILKKQNVEGNFYLAGDLVSANPSAINPQIIKNWNSEGLIIYKGHEYDFNKLYKDIDIVCLPSWREGFPKVLMEAAALGLPIITTDVPGCRDAVIKDVTAIIVPVKDPKKLALAIKNLFEDRDLRIKMGKANRNLAINKFDLKSIVPQIVELYE